MGKRKIEIKAITHERTRNSTFSKRKTGLFKKAYELGVLCSVKIAVIVFDQRPGQEEKVYEYCSGGEIPEIIHRRLKFTGPADTKRPKNYTGKADGDEDEDEDDEEVAEQLGTRHEITASPPRKKSRTLAPHPSAEPRPTPPTHTLENRPVNQLPPFQISVTVPPPAPPNPIAPYNSLPPPYPIAERQMPYPNYNLTPNASTELLDMLLRRIASSNGSSGGGPGFGIAQQQPPPPPTSLAWPIPNSQPEASPSTNRADDDWLGMLLDSRTSQYTTVPPPPPADWENFLRTGRHPQDHSPPAKSEYNEGNLIGDDTPLLFSPL